MMNSTTPIQPPSNPSIRFQERTVTSERRFYEERTAFSLGNRRLCLEVTTISEADPTMARFAGWSPSTTVSRVVDLSETEDQRSKILTTTESERLEHALSLQRQQISHLQARAEIALATVIFSPRDVAWTRHSNPEQFVAELDGLKIQVSRRLHRIGGFSFRRYYLECLDPTTGKLVLAEPTRKLCSKVWNEVNAAGSSAGTSAKV